MFTGIVESISTVKSMERQGANITFGLEGPFTNELRVDQSVAHDGVCLTVVRIENNIYYVTAIQETLDRTNLGLLTIGSKVNVERCVLVGGRLDGHIVQGHVDCTATCDEISDMQGSWTIRFGISNVHSRYFIEKGSICINGVSLTVVKAGNDFFTVAVIPYTYQHTTMGLLKPGDKVNLEFDVIGKYVERMLGQR
jgi:riboflavin synthase